MSPNKINDKFNYDDLVTEITNRILKEGYTIEYTAQLLVKIIDVVTNIFDAEEEAA